MSTRLDDRTPCVVWRRTRPRPGRAATTGDIPQAPGDWSVDHITYRSPSAALAVEAPPARRAVPPHLELALIKPLFLEVIDLLNRHDFPYWADSGTLLGTMRHGGIIPWDKDCDLGIRRTDRAAFIRLIRTMPGFGMKWETGPTMWIVSEKYGIRVSDVFTYSFSRRFRARFWEAHAKKYGVDVGAGYLLYDQPMFRRYLDQRFNIPCSLFYPVRTAPFYDRRIKVASRARTLLRGMYGEQCFTHASSNGVNSEGVRLTSVAPL